MQVFLSYNTPDHAAAEALKGAIERTHAGAKVFFAPYNLKLGAFWLPQLGEAIAASDAFLILLGRGLGEWQKLEYYEAINRHLTAKKAGVAPYPVVPVIVGERAPNLPFLHQLHWIQSGEPTAPEPVGQIVAGLAGDEIAAAAPWRTINPYRGLLALREEDADFFFGRDDETAEIVRAIATRQDKLINLIGNSGVGKSSLVQAGVISALKRHAMPDDGGEWPEQLNDARAWAYLTMKPGDNPIRALASAFTSQWFEDPTDPLRAERTDGWEERLNGRGRLPELVDATQERFHGLGIEPPRRVFLYLDQGEELYARGTTETIRRFSELIADGLSDERLIVMGSQRSDYYGHLQNNEALFPEKTECIDVPPLRASSLKAVLREPARVLGARVEPENLVDFLVESALGRPSAGEAPDEAMDAEAARQREISASAALPLLADFMTDLWSRMQQREDGNGILQLTDKTEIVRVGASLARRADSFLAAHAEAREAVRRLFTLKLALVQEAGEPVRRRVRKSECTADEWALVEQLADPEWRLLVTGAEDGEPTAELAHEVLLREWPTLERWLVDEHDFLVWKGNVERDRKAYDDAGAEHKPDALLMGLSLTKAEGWYRTRPGEDIGAANADFIQLSLDERERAEREEETRRQQELATAQKLAAEQERAATRQKWFSAALAIFGLVLAGLAWFSYDRMRIAEEQTAKAVEEEQKAVTALADAEEAKADAEQARDDANLAVDKLAQERNRAEEALVTAESNAAGGLAALSTIARNDKNPINSSKLALAAWPLSQSSESVRREVINNLSIAVPELFERRWLRGQDTKSMAAFSPDGTRLAMQPSDNGNFHGNFDIVLIDVATNQVVGRNAGHFAGRGFAFSNDGAMFAVGSSDPAAYLWRAANASPIRAETEDDRVSATAFSPDGSLLVAGSVYGNITVWSTDNFSKPIDGFEVGGEIASLAVLPGNRRIAAVNDDGASLWELRPGRVDRTIRDPIATITDIAPVIAVDYLPETANLATVHFADGEGRLRLWNANTLDEQFVGTELKLGGPSAFDFSTDSLAVGGPDGKIRIVGLTDDINAAEPPPPISETGHDGAVTSVAFDADGGMRLLSGGVDGTVRLWSLVERREIARFDNKAAQVTAVVFETGEERVVVAYSNGSVRSLDIDTDATVVWRRFSNGEVNAAVLSDDGLHSALLTDASILVVDNLENKLIATIAVPEDRCCNLLLSPAVDRVSLVGEDTVTTWGLPDGNLRSEFQRPTSNSGRFVFSPDGDRLTTFGGSRNFGFAYVIDVTTGETLLSFEENGCGEVESIIFSEDGSRVALKHALGGEVWYDLGIHSRRSVGDRGSAGDMPPECGSPNQASEPIPVVGAGQPIRSGRSASANGDGFFVLDSATGARLARFSAPGASIRDVAVAPAGNQVISLSSDGTVGIWDLSSVPAGDLFEVVCALLPDKDLQSALTGYPIRVDDPICSD